MQIVGYTSGVDGPASLSIAEDRAVRSIDLERGRTLSYSLGDRRCAGAVGDEGHRPCSATKAPYCDLHTDRWACARCTGDCDRPLEACREEHAIYLAAFAPDAFKVGVTRSWRLQTRLREQGADVGAHLRTVADGRIAREREAEIATDIGDRVRVRTKIEGLGQPLAGDEWEELLGSFEPIDRFEFDYGIDLDRRPVAETLARGTVVGTKGRILVLENGGSTYATDLRELVGHEVTEGEGEGKGDRDLQTSLGAFE